MNVNIQPGESLTVGTSKAVHGGADGNTVTIGDETGSSIQIRVGQGGHYHLSIGGMAIMTAEMVNGVPEVTFHCKVKAAEYINTTPLPAPSDQR